MRGVEREANSLTFTSSLSSQSSSEDFKTSRKIILLNSNHCVFPCRIPFLLNHVYLRHVSTSSLCGFQSTEAGSWQGCYLPPPSASSLRALVVISTRKQWRRWPSHAHKVTVARLEAPPMLLQQPSTFSQFPERAQGKARAPSRAL